MEADKRTKALWPAVAIHSRLHPTAQIIVARQSAQLDRREVAPSRLYERSYNHDISRTSHTHWQFSFLFTQGAYLVSLLRL